MDKLPMIFTLADAEQCGLSVAAVRHALAQRRLVRVRRGLFADATLWQKTSKRSRPSACARGTSGLALSWSSRLGQPLHGSSAERSAGATRSACPGDNFPGNAREGRRLNRPGVRLRTAQVDPHDVGAEWGMAVLSPARTALMWPACTVSRRAWSWRMRHWPAAWPPQQTSAELRPRWSAGTDPAVRSL